MLRVGNLENAKCVLAKKPKEKQGKLNTPITDTKGVDPQSVSAHLSAKQHLLSQKNQSALKQLRIRLEVKHTAELLPLNKLPSSLLYFLTAC